MLQYIRDIGVTYDSAQTPAHTERDEQRRVSNYRPPVDRIRETFRRIISQIN